MFYEKNGVEYETNFVNRAFAGKEPCRLYKQKIGKNKELVANHPENTLIYNYDVQNFDINLIDKQWYIDMSYRRLNGYKGVKR